MRIIFSMSGCLKNILYEIINVITTYGWKEWMNEKYLPKKNMTKTNKITIQRIFFVVRQNMKMQLKKHQIDLSK